MRPLGLLLGLFVALNSTLAFGQLTAGDKLRGEYGYYGGAAGSAMRSAQDYARNYQQYATSAKTANPDVAIDAADTVGTYIMKAQKHFAWMRNQAKTANDKETLTALDSIDKHLSAAAKSHREMLDTCLKDHVPGQPVLDCCKQVDDHLAKAIAEHDKLMKHVGAKK